MTNVPEDRTETRAASVASSTRCSCEDAASASRKRRRDYDETSYDSFDNICGFSPGDAEELMCQGVKPWDDDAGDVLAALYGGDY